jgi:uridine kinase
VKNKKLRELKKPYIIGISGGSASGKTHFVNALKAIFRSKEVCFISQDDYYKELRYQVKDENGIVNYDLPQAVEEKEFLNDLSKLIAGKAVKRKEYVFNNPHKKAGWVEIQPAPIIIIEGIFIFHFEEINKLLSLKIFIDASHEIMLQRRLERDEKERAVEKEIILYQWNNHVLPAYNAFLLPHRDLADLIITNHSGFEKGLKVMEDHIRMKIAE